MKDALAGLKKLVLALFLLFALLAGLFMWFTYSHRPPREANLTRNFQAHRASFELLRDMLQTDTNLSRLANWGVQTDKGFFMPPAGNFPVERYDKYMALLKEVGGMAAGRGQGTNADIVILVWATGFGGDTAHVGISWFGNPPTREIASLQQYYRDHKSPPGKGAVFQHLDGQWYLWTDLWTE